MTLNFYPQLNQTILFFLIATAVSYLTFSQTLTTNTVDFISRVQPGDFFLNSYYVFWTSTWYLPLFVLLLLTLVFLYVNPIISFVIHLLLILALVTFSTNYTSLLPYSLNELGWGENINPLLSNSINKYHPLLLYISLIGLVVPYLQHAQFLNIRYTRSVNVCYFATTTNSITLLISLTLFLGSWWAAQEGSWGGWWNWDASEVFGLFILISYLVYVHQTSSLQTYVVTRNSNVVSCLTALLIYFFIQLNFDLVSHNFGTSSDQFIDLTQFLTIGFLSSLVYVIFAQFNLVNLLNYSQLNLNTASLRSSWRLIYFLLMLWIILIHALSFMVLLNDLLWKVSSVNVFNFIPMNSYYSAVSLVLLLLFNWEILLFGVITLVSSVLYNSTVLLVFITVNFSLVTVIHNIILQMFFNMCFESYQYTSIWELLLFSQTQGTIHNMTNYGLPYTSLSGSYSESMYLTLSSDVLSDASWNFSRTATTNEVHTFSHNALNHFFTQDLSSGNLIFGYTISVVDSHVLSTTTLFLLAILAVYLIFNNTFIILT